MTEEKEDPAAAKGENGVGGIVNGETSWGMAVVKGHSVCYSLLVAAELGKRESVYTL